MEIYTPPPLFDNTAVLPFACTGNEPVVKSYDLSQYSGQTITIRFEVTSQNCCGTMAMFDDISAVASPSGTTTNTTGKAPDLQTVLAIIGTVATVAGVVIGVLQYRKR
jgi:hypothetical protein